jgi:hypothetical protein
MFKNRYAAPNGDQYDGCGEWPSLRRAMIAAQEALELALPGTKWLGVRPWGQEKSHAA